jgi:hypothetical protein
MANDSRYENELNDLTDEDLVEQLLVSNVRIDEDALEAEVQKQLENSVLMHGSAERALEAIEQRVERVVKSLLDRIEEESRTVGILVIVRDELVEQVEGSENPQKTVN